MNWNTRTDHGSVRQQAHWRSGGGCDGQKAVAHAEHRAAVVLLRLLRLLRPLCAAGPATRRQTGSQRFQAALCWGRHRCWPSSTALPAQARRSNSRRGLGHRREAALQWGGQQRGKARPLPRRQRLGVQGRHLINVHRQLAALDAHRVQLLVHGLQRGRGEEGKRVQGCLGTIKTQQFVIECKSCMVSEAALKLQGGEGARPPAAPHLVLGQLLRGGIAVHVCAAVPSPHHQPRTARSRCNRTTVVSAQLEQVGTQGLDGVLQAPHHTSTRPAAPSSPALT